MEKRPDSYDFSGWATRNDIKCSDGRVIKHNAFQANDGQTVPLVWNHSHNEPENVLGHALLENRDEGVYCYGTFNDTSAGAVAKTLVQHGDIKGLSIYANQLKQVVSDVVHGNIREVSLVLAGANPGAYIDTIIEHSEDSDEEAIIYMGEQDFSSPETISHADDKEEDKEDKKDDSSKSDGKEETIGDVYNTLTDKQKNVVLIMISEALKEGANSNDKDEEEDNKEETNVKHNVFEQDANTEENVLSHSAQSEIISLAKQPGFGSFKAAFKAYCEDQNNSMLQHAYDDDDLDSLFPDYTNVPTGAPPLVTRDQGWISSVIDKTHKNPFTRIRTRQMDIRENDTTTGIRAYGYEKAAEKRNMGNMKLLTRTTDPQTIYVKDYLNRDDVIDITDFDAVSYMYDVMRMALNEEIAMAIMVGDQREDGDSDKISEEHIRPIYTDDDLYCIHAEVDIDAAREELQGTNTEANFGDNYVYAEAIISAALYAREDYKGSGNMAFYCTPHLLNVMLLARDLNGRRIYDSKSDLASALNVTEIYTAEQFEGVTREVTDGTTVETKQLLGLFVNLEDYHVGSTKGGEITKFDDFDIEFNQYRYLIETRLSGALARVYSAIALEEDVTESTEDESES